MPDVKKGRYGKLLFALLTLGILSAIVATFLLANDHRNLNRALVHFGFEPIAKTSAATEALSPDSRGRRIPRPKVDIPERLVSPIVPMETKFARTVRRDPKELCSALQRTGFANSGWQEGLAGGGWECTSFREFAADGNEDSPKTSAYLSIRGSNEERLTSFRIKLNLEDEATRAALTDAAIATVGVFFEEVRWNEAPEILDNLLALKEFDVVVFGNRIQLKREFGDTPRFNFIITPDRSRPKNTYLPPYFDREKWLPMPDPPMAAK